MSKVKIGVKNLHFAEMAKDSAAGVQYKVPQHIADLITVTLDTTTNSGTLYADDKPIEVATTYGGTKVSIEIADLPLSVQAALLGHTYENGMLKKKDDDKAPYVAILYETSLADGTTEYHKVLKGMFRVPKSESSTKKDTIEFKTTSIEGDFVSRTYDGRTEDVARSDNEDAATAIEKWYDYVESSETTVVEMP